MIVLDLPPQIEQKILQMAEHQSISISELITQLIEQGEQKRPMLLSDFVKTLPNRTHLGGGLKIQKALRDEWD